jgi:hypothetical protein
MAKTFRVRMGYVVEGTVVLTVGGSTAFLGVNAWLEHGHVIELVWSSLVVGLMGGAAAWWIIHAITHAKSEDTDKPT